MRYDTGIQYKTDAEFDIASEDDEQFREVSGVATERSVTPRREWHELAGCIGGWTLSAHRRVRLGLMVAAVVLTTLVFLSPGYQSSPLVLSNQSSRQSAYSHYVEESRSLPRPSVIPPLQELCSGKTWHEGLYFSSYNSAGGLGNVQAYILDYVRFAIEAGATGLVLPMIQRRGVDLKSGTLREGLYEPFTYMFDEEWFIESVQLSCPQMTVLRELEDITNLHKAHFPDSLRPIDLTSETWFNTQTAQFGSDFLEWLGYTPSAEQLTVVRLHPAIFEFHTGNDSPALYASFGRILRIHERLRILAARVYVAIQDLGNSAANFPYLGAHLRVEADLTKFAHEWPTYEVQRDSFFSIAAEKNLTLMYVASGDIAALDRVREESAERGLAVKTKYDLLDRETLSELEELTFDQQGIVDYLVLRNSTFFVGTAPSSFSYEVAYSRHLEVSELTRFPYPRDDRSQINGADFYFCQWGMWPLADCLWRSS